MCSSMYIPFIAREGRCFFSVIPFINSVFFPVPDILEQMKIVEYLDTKTFQISNIIEIINTQLEKQKELRKTLINDVVTGKIKVFNDEVA